MSKSPDKTPILLGLSCAAVGVLAATGTFNSVMAFPLVFAAICLLMGFLALWRDRPRRAVALRGSSLVGGVVVAACGWLYQQGVVAERLSDRRQQVVHVMQGEAVPALTGLEPLNTNQQVWDEAAAFTARATVVTFWARWCSPCWKEMAELEELFRQHHDRGFRVVALTRYDEPEDPEERTSDLAKARRFLESREFTFPAAITDRDDVYRAYRVHSPPATFLVDDTGRVVDYANSLESFRALTRQATQMLIDEADESS